MRISERGRGQDQVLTTRVGLRIPANLTFEGWEHAGRHIAQVLNTSAWCLGDWLVFGQDKYPDRYRRAIAAAGLDYQTLRNYAWVVRRFEVPRRRQRLSFQHHAEVASLPPVEQERWLDRAEAEGWSKSQLRKHVRSSRHDAASTAEPMPLLPRVHLSVDRIARWRAAAAQSHRALDEWMVETLEVAASAALGDEGRTSASDVVELST